MNTLEKNADGVMPAADWLPVFDKNGSFLFVGEDTQRIADTVTMLALRALCTGGVEKGSSEGYCGQCSHCRQGQNGQHPDIVWFEPKGASASIRIEDIRRLKEQAYLKPFQARKKIVIIRDAERMTTEAANALLKILEEPPADVVLVLTARSVSPLLPTVVSRCQLVRFSETMQPSDNNNEVIDTLVARLMDAVLPLVERGAEEDPALDRAAAEGVMQELAYVFRDMMILSQGIPQAGLMSRQPDMALNRWLRMFDTDSLEQLVDEMLRMKGYIRGNANIKLSLDLTAKAIAARKNRS